MSDAHAWGLADRVHVAGYVPDDALTDYLLAADICACLRWPTNHETSASWLRCLAAGRTTLITELAHLADVPRVDPRGWRPLHDPTGTPAPAAVSIDLLDEHHSLQLALERLAEDPPLRHALGHAARAHWHARHRLEPMADAYARLLRYSAILPTPEVTLPAHLQDEGTAELQTLMAEMGLVDHAASVDIL